MGSMRGEGRKKKPRITARLHVHVGHPSPAAARLCVATVVAMDGCLDSGKLIGS